jgi:hypothetical protein
MKKNVIGATLLCFGLVSVGMPVQADGVSLVTKSDSSINSMTKKEAKKLWLGKTKTVGGQTAVPSDNEESNANKIFYKKAVKKKPAQLKAYWAKKMFSGKAMPPKKLGDDDEVKEWVNETDHGVGYINNESVDDSVKILLKLP